MKTAIVITTTTILVGPNCFYTPIHTCFHLYADFMLLSAVDVEVRKVVAVDLTFIYAFSVVHTCFHLLAVLACYLGFTLEREVTHYVGILRQRQELIAKADTERIRRLSKNEKCALVSSVSKTA